MTGFDLGKEPQKAAPAAGKAPASAAANTGKGQLNAPISYVVTYGGKSHTVTVAPGE